MLFSSSQHTSRNACWAVQTRKMYETLRSVTIGLNHINLGLTSAFYHTTKTEALRGAESPAYNLITELI